MCFPFGPSAMQQITSSLTDYRKGESTWVRAMKSCIGVFWPLDGATGAQWPAALGGFPCWDVMFRLWRVLNHQVIQDGHVSSSPRDFSLWMFVLSFSFLQWLQGLLCFIILLDGLYLEHNPHVVRLNLFNGLLQIFDWIKWLSNMNTNPPKPGAQNRSCRWKTFPSSVVYLRDLRRPVGTSGVAEKKWKYTHGEALWQE